MITPTLLHAAPATTGITPGFWLPLFVAVPLTAAAICVLTPPAARRTRDFIHLLTPILVIAGAIALLVETLAHGPVGHGVGAYVGGIAIPFVGDPFAAIMILTTGIVALVSNWFGSAIGETKARFFPALTLMLVAGVNGALLTADLFNLFVFIEVMLLPSYGLLAMTGSWARLAGGRMFVLINLLASTVLLVGVGFVYASAGSTNIAVLAGAAHGNGMLTAGLGLVIIALAIKAGVFPVHTWLPRAYPSGSPAVMSLFSGLHTKVAAYAIFRIFAVIFGLDERWSILIVVVCCITMLVGGFAGLGEHSLRRIVAYQMVAGVPFILIVLAFTGTDPSRALAAGMFYALHSMITTACLILTVGAVEETYGTGMLSKLHGLARREPLIATVFVMGAFSIVGFPPFSGTWAKVGVVMAVAQPGQWTSWITITVIILASFGALLSMLRLWREAFWGKNMNPKRFPAELLVPTKATLPGLSLGIMSVAMFFLVGPISQITVEAADQLIDVPAYQQAVLGDATQAIGIDGVEAVSGSRDEKLPAVTDFPDNLPTATSKEGHS